VYLAAAALCLKRVSDYSYFGFKDFFDSLKQAWLSGIVLGGFVLLAILLMIMIIPFYINMASPVGIVLAVLLFWALLTGVLSLQFFLSIRSRMNNPIRKSIKKCFIIFIDNPGYCVFSLIHNTVLLALSVFLAFLVPGPAGILLFLDEALRLRLLKYDWLELNPGTGQPGKRPQIPWDEILIDERENTGTRSFKSFIFPWKE
jgi:uncharacterized membrane protein YesL